MSKNWWGNEQYDPKYDSQVPASPDSWKKTPGKKDTNKWCRGKVGRPHDTEIVIPHNQPGWVERGCGYIQDWRRWREERETGVKYQRWHCAHAEVCKRCGKHVVWQLSAKDCPIRLDNPINRTVELSA